jgi:urease accessory protein
MLRRATRVHPTGHWPQADAAGSVTLAFDDRFRRRIQLNDDSGDPFLLDLARAVVLNDGDALELEALARIAWHLGNRHLPVQIAGDAVRLRWDHVIADMLAGMGAEVVRLRAGFTPESGAYAHHDH